MTSEPTGSERRAARAAGACRRMLASMRQDGSRLLRTGVPHVFAALLGTQGITMIQRILLARILSVADVGQMAYVMSVVSFLLVFADLGACTAVLKFAAEPISEQARRHIYVTGLVWSTSCATLLGLLYAAVVASLNFGDEPSLRIYMLIAAPYIPLSAVAMLPILFMQARKDVKRAARYTVITRVLGLTLTAVATYCWGLWGFFVTLSAAPLSNLLLLLFATRTQLVWISPTLALLSKLLRFGFFSMLANATGVANAAVAVVFLKHLTHSLDEVGQYANGLVLMNGIRMLPDALMQVAFPYLSGLIGEPVRLRQRIRELSGKQCAVVCGAIVLWLLCGRLAITLVFGSRWSPSFWPSVILMIGLIPFSISAPFSRTMIILNQVVLNLAVAGVQLALNVALCFLLIPPGGSLGAAAAVSAAQLGGSALAIIVTRRALRRHAAANQ